MLDWLMRDGKDLAFKQNSGYSVKNLSYPPITYKNNKIHNVTITYAVLCCRTLISGAKQYAKHVRMSTTGRENITEIPASFLGVGVGGCLLLKTHHRCTYEDKRSLHSHRSTIYTRIFQSAFRQLDAKSIKPLTGCPVSACCGFEHSFITLLLFFFIYLQAACRSLHLRDQIKSTAMCQIYKLQAYISCSSRHQHQEDAQKKKD